MPYCTRCGKLMKEGSKFCTACGAPLEETPEAAERTTVLPREDEATRMMPHAAVAQPSSTASMPPVEPGVDETPGPKTKSKASLVIALIVAIAVVLVLVFVLMNGNFFPGNSSQSDSATTEQTDTDAAKNAKNGTGNVEVKGDPNVIGDGDSDDDDDTDYEQTVYDELTRYYDDLDGLDASVRSCATEFNQNYLDGDYTTRQNAAGTADRLEDKIDDALDQLEDLDIDRASKNYRSWRSIINLYQDLEHRIDVINEAWEIDLRYADDPSSHKDDIIAPLSADNISGTNDNKYRLDYEKNYADAKPVEP